MKIDSNMVRTLRVSFVAHIIPQGHCMFSTVLLGAPCFAKPSQVLFKGSGRTSPAAETLNRKPYQSSADCVTCCRLVAPGD